MDTYILHKVFLQYLREPEPPVDFEYPGNKRMVDIRCYELRMYDVKERFIGLYGYVYRVLSPRLNKLSRWVHVLELGGTIEIKDPEFDEAFFEIKLKLEECEKLYGWIREYENWIFEEHRLMEQEKDAEVLKKYRYERWKSLPIDAPQCKGKQLNITFE